MAGLTGQEAARGLQEWGPNLAYAPPPLRFVTILWEEVREPMIVLLLFVGVLYSVLGKLEDTITIFAVIVALVLAEVFNEFRAKKAIAALGRVTAPTSRVVRDGEVVEIATAGIVPGDLVELAVGTRVPADGAVQRSTGLQVDESALTGESMPVAKAPGDAVYAATVVAGGNGEFVAAETGERTRLGALAREAAEVRPPRTRLQLAMRSLAGKLVWVAVAFSALIPLLGVVRGQDLKTMFLTGLSLSFATIPEELPIIITMVLGLGAFRLSRRGFLVKQLTAAETLGATTVIVTDKTGTITENRMTLAVAYPADAGQAALAAALATVVEYAPATNPIEDAVRRAAKESGVSAPDGDITRLRDIGDGGRHKSVVRGSTLYVSGAPEEVLAACAHVPAAFAGELEAEAGRGRRVVAVAQRPLSAREESDPWERIERDMEPLGLLSFEDPPRQGVADTVRRAAAAGIRTIMVTGDHPATAAAIAAAVGIFSPEERTVPGSVMTGVELGKLTEQDLATVVRGVSVFARTTPQDKYRIVAALQGQGEVVAVTGDGINDALALRGADIGIAMGTRGTDVAKEAAAAVLADDDYVTIAEATWEGRTFFDNLRKGVKYYLSVKAALVAVFLLPVLVGLPLPFSPIQIIVLELFMDLAASAGFVAEPPEKDVYTRRPRAKTAALFDRSQVVDLFAKAAFLFAGVTGVYLWARAVGLPFDEQRTLAFAAWIVGHVALAFVSRSDHQSLLTLGVLRNRVVDLWALAAAAFLLVWVYVPLLARPLGLVAVPPATLATVAACVVLWIALVEVWKALWRRSASALD